MTQTALPARAETAGPPPARQFFNVSPASGADGIGTLRPMHPSARRDRARATHSENQRVVRHTPLVRKIAFGLSRQIPANMELDDLLQAGMIGLLESLRAFDPARGVAFATYAGVRIHGAMMDEIRRVLWAPRSVFQKARQVERAVREIQNETGRRPGERELAERLGISANACVELIEDASARTLFPVDDLLESKVADSRDGPLEQLENEMFTDHLIEATGRLSPRERSVMQMYYVEDLKLHEIGERLGLTESRVCQLHKQAVNRLREILGQWRADGALPV